MDLTSFVEYHRKHIQSAQGKREQARKEAYAALGRMKLIFEATPGLKRVYLFGSLNRSHFREDSDIDIAVEGLNPEVYLRFSTQVQKVTGRQVDVVDLADCDQKFADFIRKFGRIIYEQPY